MNKLKRTRAFSTHKRSPEGAVEQCESVQMQKLKLPCMHVLSMVKAALRTIVTKESCFFKGKM